MTAVAATKTGLLTFQRTSTTRLSRAMSAVSQSHLDRFFHSYHFKHICHP